MKKFLKLLTDFSKKRHLNVILGIILGIALGLLFFNLYFLERIYPGIYVNSSYVGNLKVTESIKLLSQNTKVPEEIILKSDVATFEIETETFGLKYDFIKTSERAFSQYRTGNILFDMWGRITSLFQKKSLGLAVLIDEKALDNILAEISGSIYVEPVYPEIKIVNKEVLVDQGRTGVDLEKKLLRARIGEALSQNKTAPIDLPIKALDPRLSNPEAAVLKIRGEKLMGKSMELVFEFQSFYFSDDEILGFLSKDGFDKEKISDKISEISKTIDREPQDSKFVFDSGRVKEFAPSKNGVKVQNQKLLDDIISTLSTFEKNANEKFASLMVPIEETPAKLTTEEVNNLGIKELIGRGSSTFRGSIASRVHNVGHAASKFNGVLIGPGELLSFNDALGDVSTLTGYQQAYVIKDGRTVLGDGGGVCQVSTTLFRAALNAGLPITERRAHSYRVSYYEQDVGPGLDATVYAPTTDLKILNDTPGHILVQTYFDAKNYSLVFEIYGTSDGRIASTTKPTTTGIVPPPDDLYQDDPTLPAGTIKQVEHKSWGAKTSFGYTVAKNGEVVYEKTFVSNYRPWQAVFLRGTGPVQ